MKNEKMRQKISNTSVLYVRNFIFGVEDSLVSTVGLVSGIAAASAPPTASNLNGDVRIFVEAFSMAIGSLFSENSAREYETKKDIPLFKSAKGALVMFFAYFCSGFIPLLPYILTEGHYAFWASIIASVLTLFILGAVSAKIFGTGAIKHGLEMFFLGGGAIALGVAVGKFAHSNFLALTVFHRFLV